MVGSPIYQTCQHVYTAVTRGVRQVIVVNDPKNLEAAVKLKPFSRNTKLQQFLTADLKKPSASVSDEAEMDEEDALVSSAGAKTSECPGSGDDDVFDRQSLDVVSSSSSYSAGSQFSGSSTDLTAWEEVFKEDDDEEILAWALEVEQDGHWHSLNPQLLPSTERTDHCKPQDAGLGNTTAATEFHISRSNLKIKQERRDLAECHEEKRCNSVVDDICDDALVSAGDFFAERNSVTVKSEKPNDKKPGVKGSPCDQFSGSLADLAQSAINSYSFSVNQGSPSPNSASTVGYNSPKTCPKRFSETSAFPTPPQTPPGIQTTPSTSAKQLSNTFPRKSHHPRSTPFRKSGGTPAKGRRRSLKARYDAWCNVCRNPIRAGVDEITHMESASNTSWVHQKCI